MTYTLIEDLIFFLIPLFLILLGIGNSWTWIKYNKTGVYEGVILRWDDEKDIPGMADSLLGIGVITQIIGIILMFILLAGTIKSYFNFANPIPLLLSGSITSLIPIAITWYFYRYWKKEDHLSKSKEDEM